MSNRSASKRADELFFLYPYVSRERRRCLVRSGYFRCLAEWMNQQHHKIVDHLTGENRVLKQQLGGGDAFNTHDRRAAVWLSRPGNSAGESSRYRDDRHPRDFIAVESEVDGQYARYLRHPLFGRTS
jgi:hypothetical protein